MTTGGVVQFGKERLSGNWDLRRAARGVVQIQSPPP